MLGALAVSEAETSAQGREDDESVADADDFR